MAKSLVIVESPTKAKTLAKYLGRNYQVLASVGHLKDLPKRKFGIDLEQSRRQASLGGWPERLPDGRLRRLEKMS
jgi:DNA topoisomerase IA